MARPRSGGETALDVAPVEIGELSEELSEVMARWNDKALGDVLYEVATEPEMSGHRWKPEDFFAHGAREMKAIMDELDRVVPDRARGRAMDFGCGPGRCAEALANHYERVDGVDVSEEMVRIAREMSPRSRVTYHLNVERNLALFGDDSFDLVYSANVMQHNPPAMVHEYVDEIARVLRPGGVMMVDVKSADFPAPPDHEMTAWVAAAGLTLLESEFAHFYLAVC